MKAFSRALKELIEGLLDLERLGRFTKLKKKDKITEAVAKAGRDMDKLVQKFIVRPSRSSSGICASHTENMCRLGRRSHHGGSHSERPEAKT